MLSGGDVELAAVLHRPPGRAQHGVDPLSGSGFRGVRVLRRGQPASPALKAWNLYTVFLSPAPCSTETTRLLFAMEEDFRGTRKIARAGLTGRDDIELALAPLLPLRNLRVVGIEDATSRLEQRLGAIGQALTDLGRDVPAGAIAARLMVTK